MTTAHPPEARRPREEGILLWLEVLLAVGALGGAIGLISGGVDLGPATADLPFGSAVFAGWALGLVNFALPTVVVLAALRRSSWARVGHHLVGVALVGWITGQVAFLGWPPHWLQVGYFLYGLVILALAARVPVRVGIPAGVRRTTGNGQHATGRLRHPAHRTSGSVTHTEGAQTSSAHRARFAP